MWELSIKPYICLKGESDNKVLGFQTELCYIVSWINIEFIETRGFTKSVKALKAQGVFEKLKVELDNNPEKGDLVQGTGGFRKVRMRLPGRGKS